MTDRFTLASMEKAMEPVFKPTEPVEAPAICSFCHKPDHHVEMMLLGSFSAVCSECIDLFARILNEYRENEKIETLSEDKPDEIKVHSYGKEREAE